MYCVKDDISKKGVSEKMTADRVQWKKMPCCADPHVMWDKGRKRRSIYGLCDWS